MADHLPPLAEKLADAVMKAIETEGRINRDDLVQACSHVLEVDWNAQCDALHRLVREKAMNPPMAYVRRAGADEWYMINEYNPEKQRFIDGGPELGFDRIPVAPRDEKGDCQMMFNYGATGCICRACQKGQP